MGVALGVRVLETDPFPQSHPCQTLYAKDTQRPAVNQVPHDDFAAREVDAGYLVVSGLVSAEDDVGRQELSDR